MEEDTGKLTHLDGGGSLVDYNRSGVPLLEIVSEPDIRSGEEARAYAMKIRQILRYLGVNSGDMEKGVLPRGAQYQHSPGGQQRIWHAHRAEEPEQFPRRWPMARRLRLNGRRPCSNPAAK